MKTGKSYLLVCLLLMAGSYGFSQTYYPLVQTNKVWSISYFYAGPPSQIKYIKFEGDTVFDGNSYKTIWFTNDSVQYGWINWGYIRETADHKVHYLSSPGGFDVLMYDFSVTQGDTLYVMSIQQPFIADTVDSVQVLTGEWRKRIIIHASDEMCRDTWIEGIGSLYGVLECAQGCLIGETSELVCMLQNGTLIYHYPGYTDCDTPLKINTPASEDPPLIYPNPVGNDLTVQLYMQHFAWVEISDIYGRTRVKENLLNRENRIDLRDLAKGIYFVKITYQYRNDALIQKIIKL